MRTLVHPRTFSVDLFELQLHAGFRFACAPLPLRRQGKASRKSKKKRRILPATQACAINRPCSKSAARDCKSLGFQVSLLCHHQHTRKRKKPVSFELNLFLHIASHRAMLRTPSYWLLLLHRIVVPKHRFHIAHTGIDWQEKRRLLCKRRAIHPGSAYITYGYA